ncbi:MAG: CGNR zinc finger domain-containing protein [Gaiellaceae bacterium]
MADGAQPGDRKPAPGRLALVQNFINSVDLEDGPDEFATIEGLRAFLLRERLLARAETVSEQDRRHAVELREALRALALTNNGFPLPVAAARTLNSHGNALPLVAQFQTDGRAALVPVRSGASGAFAAILAIVCGAMEEGSWPRFKACRSEVCGWAFFDHSKNRRGRWCSMAVCGSRSKSRSYAERHRVSEA